MNNAVTSTATLPSYLVEVQFPFITLNWSSTTTITWDSKTWEARDIDISGLGTDTSTTSQGMLRLGIDSTQPDIIATYVLDSTNYGFSNRPIKVWFFDQSLVSGGVLTETPLKLFDGVGDNASLNPLNAEVSLVNPGIKTSFLPRVRISEANGFSKLQAKGTRITWNNEIFILE